MLNYNIKELLSQLDNEMIEKIDKDPLIKVRKHENGLSIANASKRLFMPKEQHHLYAKGIVYDEEYNLVSLPLIKIYNYGIDQFPTDLAKELFDTSITRGSVNHHLAHKADGTMIQMFTYKEEVYFSTRSVLEGTEKEHEEESLYINLAKKVMYEKYPVFMNIFRSFNMGTMIFELIHPDIKQIVDYGDLEDMILIARFKDGRYLTDKAMRKTAEGHRLSMGAHVDLGSSHMGIECLVHFSNEKANQDVSEGHVLVFEQDHQVIHRVKIKGARYLELFKLRWQCNEKAVAAFIFNNEVSTWEEFQSLLKETGSLPEELLGDYENLYISHTWWLTSLKDVMDSINEGIVKLADGVSKKEFAISMKNHPDFSLYMKSYDGKLKLRDVAKLNPLFKGCEQYVRENE